MQTCRIRQAINDYPGHECNKGVRCVHVGAFQGSFVSRATSTRLSKKVAPPPKSLRRELVVALQLVLSLAYLFHQILGHLIS